MISQQFPSDNDVRHTTSARGHSFSSTGSDRVSLEELTFMYLLYMGSVRLKIPNEAQDGLTAYGAHTATPGGAVHTHLRNGEYRVTLGPADK